MNYLSAKRFLIIGALSTAINYCFFAFLYLVVHAPYVWASILGYLLGMMFGYIFNRKWTFSSKNERKIFEFTTYLSVYLLSMFIGVVVLKFSVEILRITPLISNIFAIGVSTVTNYVGCSFVVFRKDKELEKEKDKSKGE